MSTSFRHPDHPDVLQRDFESIYDEAHALHKEVERLRARTHEIQAEEAEKRASLESQLAHHRRCRNLAEAAVAEYGADWCKGGPGTFWSHTSQNTKDALTGLVEESARLTYALNHGWSRGQYDWACAAVEKLGMTPCAATFDWLATTAQTFDADNRRKLPQKLED